MDRSLNEIEAMAKKAARGAGLPWGLAEDVGKSVRWLEAYDLGGTEILARYLSSMGSLTTFQTGPTSVNGIWTAPCGTLCPIVTGAALSDHASKIKRGAKGMSKIRFPLLLVPYAAAAAERIHQPITLLWKGARITVDGKKVAVNGDATNVRTDKAIALRCQITAEDWDGYSAKLRGDVDPIAWDKLGEFAHKTYAPATEESRLSGAGAGTTDND